MEITDDHILTWQLQVAKGQSLTLEAQRSLLEEIVDLREEQHHWEMNSPLGD